MKTTPKSRNASQAQSRNDRWPTVRIVAEAELRRLVESLKELDELHAETSLDGDQAFEILCTRWESAKTSIRRTHRSKPDLRFVPACERPGSV